MLIAYAYCRMGLVLGILTKAQVVRKATDKTDGLGEEEETHD